MTKTLKTIMMAGLLVGSLAMASWAKPVGTAFSTPEAATQALANALKTYDRSAMTALFGPGLHKVEATDPSERAAALKKLGQLFKEGWSLATNQGGDRVLRLGAEGWSFPVPLTKTAKGWQFDTDAGIEEVDNRRIGRNELALIETCRQLVEAESLYKESQGKYTVKLASTEGQKDGLYWPAQGEQLSPLGQTFGDVATFSTSRQKGAPWFGYYFDVRATDNGYLISAWPQIYMLTGVMSFTCDQDGKVYQQDLGREAGSLLRVMKTIDVKDGGWTLVDD